MLVLLSPSKTQDFETPAKVAAYTQPALLGKSQILIQALRSYSKSEIAGLMGVSEKIASLNCDRYRKFATPFTLANAKPAVFAFQGDVYDGLDAENLSQEALEFAQGHVRILSGLYGILRPLDLIQPYRLEMKTKLKNPAGRDLYAFWGDRLTDMLNEQLQALELKVVINLASEEYFRAINPKKLAAKLITPEFREKKSGGYKMIGLFAKKARGRMTHYIAQNQITTPDALRFFAEDGYRFNVKLSTADRPVYARG